MIAFHNSRISLLTNPIALRQKVRSFLSQSKWNQKSIYFDKDSFCRVDIESDRWVLLFAVHLDQNQAKKVRTNYLAIAVWEVCLESCDLIADNDCKYFVFFFVITESIFNDDTQKINYDFYQLLSFLAVIQYIHEKSNRFYI